VTAFFDIQNPVLNQLRGYFFSQTHTHADKDHTYEVTSEMNSDSRNSAYKSRIIGVIGDRQHNREDSNKTEDQEKTAQNI
jgi:hypothetical protein